MRIRCPSCSATYEVADALLDPPRVVRCARCAHDWMAEPVAEEAPSPPKVEPPVAPGHTEPPVPEPVPEAAAVVEADADDREPEPALGDTPLSAIERLSAPVDLSPKVQRRDRLLTMAWAGSFALLAALGVAGYTQRDRLMQEWPASKRVYARLGLVPADAKAPETAAEH